jgi:hypothetical protein
LTLEERRAYQRAYYARNPEYREKKRQRAKQQWEENPEACREARRKEYAKLRAEVLAAYGGKCTCCGESHPNFLAIDHVNGGGNRHRKEIGGGGHVMWRWLRKSGYPEGFQILCHNCNQAKGFYGACPHQGEDF